MASTILVADDDRAIRMVLNQALARLGHDVRMTGSAATLWRWVADGEGDLVITDVIMPDENGLDLIPRIKKIRPELRIIVMSAQNTLMTAVKATERGAFEYLPKPFDLRELVSVVERALTAPRDVPELLPEDDLEDQLPLIGRSPAMQEIYRVLARLMGTDLTVTIIGESPFDRRHFLAIAGFLPVIAVIRQQHIALEPTAMQRQCGILVVGDAHRQHVADQKIGISAFGRREGGQRLRQVRQAGIGEQHAVGDLGRKRHHALAQCGEHDRRQGTDAVNRFELLDKGAGIGKRLAWGNPEALIHRAVGDADAKAKAPTPELVDTGGTRREFFGRLRIVRRDRGAEADALGSQRQPGALRHVAVATRHIDARKTAPLDLTGNVEGLAASPRYGDQTYRR